MGFIMVSIPEGVEVRIDGQMLSVKGPRGELSRTLPLVLSAEISEKSIEIKGNDKSLVNTLTAHLKNMIKGVTEGYKLKMKIVYAHFPISLEVKGNDVLIKNFLGEKLPRSTKIIGDTKIEVKGQDVTVSGPDKEAVYATAANLRNATKIKQRDPRVFQDGIYIVE